MRPQGRRDIVEVRQVHRPHSGQNDFVATRAAKQIRQQQILFIVEAATLLVRIVKN